MDIEEGKIFQLLMLSEQEYEEKRPGAIEQVITEFEAINGEALLLEATNKLLEGGCEPSNRNIALMYDDLLKDLLKEKLKPLIDERLSVLIDPILRFDLSVSEIIDLADKQIIQLLNKFDRGIYYKVRRGDVVYLRDPADFYLKDNLLELPKYNTIR